MLVFFIYTVIASTVSVPITNLYTLLAPKAAKAVALSAYVLSPVTPKVAEPFKFKPKLVGLLAICVESTPLLDTV